MSRFGCRQMLVRYGQTVNVAISKYIRLVAQCFKDWINRHIVAVYPNIRYMLGLLKHNWSVKYENDTEVVKMSYYNRGIRAVVIYDDEIIVNRVSPVTGSSCYLTYRENHTGSLSMTITILQSAYITNRFTFCQGKLHIEHKHFNRITTETYKDDVCIPCIDDKSFCQRFCHMYNIVSLARIKCSYE